MSAGVCLGRRALLGMLGAAVFAGCGRDVVVSGPGLPGMPFPGISALDLLDSEQAESAMSTVEGALVVNFWASWCGPCRAEMPALQRLDNYVRGEGIRVVAVSIDRDRNLAREFVRGAQIRFPVYFDVNGSYSTRALGLRTLPETFVVDAAGIIRARVSGARDWSSSESVRFVTRRARGQYADSPA